MGSSLLRLHSLARASIADTSLQSCTPVLLSSYSNTFRFVTVTNPGRLQGHRFIAVAVSQLFTVQHE